jgi:Kelch motif protein/galactose oxidase-like protein
MKQQFLSGVQMRLRALAGVVLVEVMLLVAVPGASPVGNWNSTGSMSSTHGNGSTATLLHNGTVLVVGGLGVNNASTATAELYDPHTGFWSSVGSMSTPRTGHTATLLHNGMVLVTGGLDQMECFPSCVPQVFASAELYDPKTASWSPTGSMSTARAQHTAVLLHDGKVLIAGGFSNSEVVSSAEIYDPKSGLWVPTGSMSNARFSHISSQLHGGDILVCGGYDNSGSALGSAELYDPHNGIWSATGSLNVVRGFHHVARLHNGLVLVAGGINVPFPLPSGFPGLSSAELYDPKTGTWSNTGNMLSARFDHSLTLLHNGDVLAAGGENMDVSVLQSAELYDAKSGAWTNAANMTTPRTTHTATLLHNGDVLVAGGFFIGTGLNSAELYSP